MTTPLPCGCRRGYSFCRTAGWLWDEATAAYHASLAVPFGTDEEKKLWEVYQEKLRAYDAHFQQEKVDEEVAHKNAAHQG